MKRWSFGQLVRSGWLFGVSSAAVLGAALLPWAQTGARRRNSFELVQSAERLGFMDGRGPEAAANLWYGVPLLAALVIAALLLGSRRTAALLAIALGVVSVAGFFVVNERLPTRYGAPLTAVAGATTLVLAATWLITRGRSQKRISMTRHPEDPVAASQV